MLSSGQTNIPSNQKVHTLKLQLLSDSGRKFIGTLGQITTLDPETQIAKLALETKHSKMAMCS